MSDPPASPTSPSLPITEQKPEPVDIDVHIKEESPSIPTSPATNVDKREADPKPLSASPSRALRRTEAQRRAFFRDDPRVQESEPQRVLCRTCQKWIKLSGSSNYALGNWLSHTQRCTTTAPTIRRTPSKRSFSPRSRVATTERKMVLLNDPQVKVCSPEHVVCGTCKAVVALEGEVEYDLAKWIEHKENCIPLAPAPITPQGSTSDKRRTFPPTSSSSSHSTEATAVPESSPAVQVGTKREREEDSEDEHGGAVDERPTNRPRTETYKPPEKEAPSMSGWFMYPLKEFARGFREGMGST
ncbi:hypothetical protein JVU11DRAFT_6539 [Chiua virens]|nr:hypothetical protein JVU11DRAFT_6539 [Chiua virens]